MKILKITCFCVVSTILFTSCYTTKIVPAYTTYEGSFKVELEQVENPLNAKEQFGSTKIITLNEEGLTKYSYEDELLRIVWFPSKTSFDFVLTNQSNHSLKIMWDEAVYVSKTGLSQKVFHSGITYANRNNPQAPTVVVKGAMITDMVVPTDNVEYSNGWVTAPLFNTKTTSLEAQENLKKKSVGEVIKVLLPIRIEETTNEYLFTFRIKDFKEKNVTIPEHIVKENDDLGNALLGTGLGAFFFIGLIWWLIDLFSAQERAKKYNFQQFVKFTNFI